jgi:hypothetical protein
LFAARDFSSPSHIVSILLLKIKVLLVKKQEGDEMAVAELEKQVDDVIKVLEKRNKHCMPVLCQPQDHAAARPMAYSPGSLEEAQLTLRYTGNAWMADPYALMYLLRK